MSGLVVVRRAVVADAAQVADLINAAFAEYRGRLKPEAGALAETAVSIALQIAAPSGGAIALRAREGDGVRDIVGCVIFKPEDRDLSFGRLSVPPGSRGWGVAGALIRFVEDEARRRGCAGVLLGVRIVLPGNQRLFARHGFVEISRHAHDGYAEPTWIKMRKSLQPTFP